MPAPAVYIIAVVGVVAAGIAFKELVYEPHLAPKFEQWAQEFVARRQARRRQRAGPVVVPVAASRGANDEEISRRRSSKRSDSSDEDDHRRESIELENLVAKEVREWRSEVDRSSSRGLRHRNNAGPSGSRTTLNEPTGATLITPTSPTHVIFNPSLPSTPTSTLPSGPSSPSVRISSVQSTHSQQSFRSPPLPRSPGKLPTPDPSINPSSPSAYPNTALHSPAIVPSLSQSYPLELDQEHGIELLSAPSSRPDSPFSSFSQPLSAEDGTQSSSVYHSFSPRNFTSPLARPPSRSMSDLDFLSDLDEHNGMSPRSTASVYDELHLLDDVRSETSESSWASAGVRSR